MFPEKKDGQLLGPALMIACGLTKCPGCEFYVFHQSDLESHLPTHWRPARYGGEWVKAEIVPDLKRQCLINGGEIVIANARYELQEWRVGWVILRTSGQDQRSSC